MEMGNQETSEQKEWLCRYEIQERALKIISWELNENIGQTLWLAKMQLEQLKDGLSKTDKIKAVETGEILSRAIRDLKRVSKQNVADEILRGGFIAGIEREIGLRQESRTHHLKLKVMGRSPEIPPALELLIFCTIQEIISDNFSKPEQQPGLISIRCRKNNISISATRQSENHSGIHVSEGVRSKLEQLNCKWSIRSATNKSIIQIAFTI